MEVHTKSPSSRVKILLTFLPTSGPSAQFKGTGTELLCNACFFLLPYPLFFLSLFNCPSLLHHLFFFLALVSCSSFFLYSHSIVCLSPMFVLFSFSVIQSLFPVFPCLWTHPKKYTTMSIILLCNSIILAQNQGK